MTPNIVIIPTYNERDNIERMIRRVFSLPMLFDVLIVDDSSPDGTGAVVKQLQQEFPGLHLLERKEKNGLGTAYIAGFQWCLAHSYAYIFEMDADFSHNPDDLIRLQQACSEQGADVAIGSRYVTGVNVVNWPMGRVLMSYYASAYVRVVTGMSIRDTTAGFVCYRREVLENMHLDRIKFRGYAFQIEMKYTAWLMGFNIVEVPIIFTDRTMGQSKMSKGIVKEAFWGVIQLRCAAIFKSNRFKRLKAQ